MRFPVPREIDERFALRVEPEPNTGCWLFVISLKQSGYCEFWDGTRYWRAHRWAYQRFRGPIPDDLGLDHRCRVRICVNPDHLEPVTQMVNVHRGVGVTAMNARKTHCPQGHVYDETNTGPANGNPRWRNCRACSRERRRARVAATLIAWFFIAVGGYSIAITQGPFLNEIQCNDFREWVKKNSYAKVSTCWPDKAENLIR